jgi:hypothetical protein
LIHLVRREAPKEARKKSQVFIVEALLVSVTAHGSNPTIRTSTVTYRRVSAF